MNEVTTVDKDRFYKPLGKMSGIERREHEEKTNTSFENPKECSMREYAPEPFHMNESRYLKFTIGKKYPVIETKHEYLSYKADYSFKTINDKEETVWVDEKYFIPADIHLMYQTEVSGFDGWIRLESDAKENNLENVVFDIRKMASEKNVKPLEVSDNCSKLDLTLSGLIESEYDGTAYYEASSTGFSRNCRKKKRQISEQYAFDGRGKDYGNPLLNSTIKCMAAVDRVFSSNKIVDMDRIIKAISVNVPHLCLKWNDYILYINDIKTKITYSEVQAAYRGLRGLVSAKIAEKTVGKLVANQLKQVF